MVVIQWASAIWSFLTQGALILLGYAWANAMIGSYEITTGLFHRGKGYYYGFSDKQHMVRGVGQVCLSLIFFFVSAASYLFFHPPLLDAIKVPLLLLYPLCAGIGVLVASIIKFVNKPAFRHVSLLHDEEYYE